MNFYSAERSIFSKAFQFEILNITSLSPGQPWLTFSSNPCYLKKRSAKKPNLCSSCISKLFQNLASLYRFMTASVNTLTSSIVFQKLLDFSWVRITESWQLTKWLSCHCLKLNAHPIETFQSVCYFSLTVTISNSGSFQTNAFCLVVWLNLIVHRHLADIFTHSNSSPNQHEEKPGIPHHSMSYQSLSTQVD